MIATPAILAIDLGMFKSVCCWFDPEAKATTFRTVHSTNEAARDALLRQPGVTALMEACSPADSVTYLYRSPGVPTVKQAGRVAKRLVAIDFGIKKLRAAVSAGVLASCHRPLLPVPASTIAVATRRGASGSVGHASTTRADFSDVLVRTTSQRDCALCMAAGGA